MKRAIVLLAFLLCGCVAHGVTLSEEVWYVHGIAVTATGAIVGGGTVELWRGTTLVASKAMTSQAFMFGTRPVAGVYQVRYTPPRGWQCASVNSVGIGWRYPSPCVGEITLPQYTMGLGPDLVFTVAYVQEPTATMPPMPPQIPTDTPTPIFSKTPIPANVTPTIEVTVTSQPWPTPPEGGWREWTDPPEELIAALRLEWEWIGSQYEQADRDPLWLAAADSGPCWAITTPVITHYEVQLPDGTNVERTLRWQLFVTPKGWRGVLATPDDPYRVAVIEIAW